MATTATTSTTIITSTGPEVSARYYYCCDYYYRYSYIYIYVLFIVRNILINKCLYVYCVYNSIVCVYNIYIKYYICESVCVCVINICQSTPPPPPPWRCKLNLLASIMWLSDKNKQLYIATTAAQTLYKLITSSTTTTYTRRWLSNKNIYC